MSGAVAAKPHRKSEERALHIAAVHFLRAALPEGVVVYHAPNGERRDKRTAQKLKAFGTLAGVSDLCFVLPTGQAAFIEFKAARGSLSPAQKAFRSAVLACGALFAECRSLADVEAALLSWGVSLRARVAA